MKPTFKNMIMSYTGKCDDLVYCYSTKFHKAYAREFVHQKQTAQNTKYGLISQNLKRLDISAGYKQDLYLYAVRYMTLKIKDRKNINNWYTIFTMLMWAMAKQLNLDLATLTREQIENDNLPCQSVKQAVEAGLIPQVAGYEYLTNTL
jgi:hypothetical protein